MFRRQYLLLVRETDYMHPMTRIDSVSYTHLDVYKRQVHINVNVKYLTTSTHGNGDLYAIGSADVSSHYTNGTNYLHLEELVIKNNIILSTYTIGDCYINAPTNGPINLEIWESGNVYYKGTPTDLYLIKKGKGEVFQK